MAAETGFVAGIDLGATKILAAVFDRGMKVRAQAKVKTPGSGSADQVLAAILSALDIALAELDLKRSDLEGLGVAVPSPVNRRKGIVLSTPNMGMKDFPLRDRLAGLSGLPVALENDVQAGTLGELRGGALRGKKYAAAFFVGTGIGGGLVLDGRLYRGSTGSAGELGHMILQDGGALCGCGRRGCLEALASRTAMARDAVAAAASGKAPILLDHAGTDFRKYRSSAFARSVESGEKAIERIVERSAYWLGVGAANVTAVLNPEAVLLGGGMVARFPDLYKDIAFRSLKDHLMPALGGTVELLITKLGDLAVPLGAAWASRDLAAGRESAAAREVTGAREDMDGQEAAE
ncbi:MAG TPA: ROK family protein [Spirochaetia bacterium]|nr:ROK family protein [Spirochaetales bacterium]HRY78961.1 ROK family protein [Spirochaetia bacterium]HRZ90421.1 ROK family protein [Spirochaetia bacterium]